MNSYENFKSRKIETVGQLIEKLQKLPVNASLSISDADIGGYDVSVQSYLDIRYNEENNCVSFGHMEYEMYEAVNKKELTYEQFKELNSE